jgi:hypothetical protein
MSIHFLASTNVVPQVAFGGDQSDSEQFDFENWLLGAGYAIPLFWLFIFSEQDLIDHPINTDPDEALSEPIQIPSTRAKIAAKRLRERVDLLNRWFGSLSPLNYHVNLFADWLDSLSYEYVSVDWCELIAESGTPNAHFRSLLKRIDAEDSSVIRDLIEISSIDTSVRFITLEEAALGKYTEEELHNFFFLLGDGDHHRPPWS